MINYLYWLIELIFCWIWIIIVSRSTNVWDGFQNNFQNVLLANVTKHKLNIYRLITADAFNIKKMRFLYNFKCTSKQAYGYLISYIVLCESINPFLDNQNYNFNHGNSIKISKKLQKLFENFTTQITI